jgi:hypothetical protein
LISLRFDLDGNELVLELELKLELKLELELELLKKILNIMNIIKIY